jgi:DNA-binding CsgD family transcriptional regulator
MVNDTIGLSKRQYQVVELLLQGKSNKQIALELGVSESTIEFHLRNIYRKLQVSSRTEAILKLRQSTVATQGELRKPLVDRVTENRHNGGTFIQEMKMKNRLFCYFLAGLLFGAIYWFYGNITNILNGLPLPDYDYWQIWLSLSITFVIDYGVWLFPAIVPAVVEYRHSQKMSSSVMAVVVVWVSTVFGYSLSYVIVLAFIGLPQMEYLLVFNEHSPDFWQHWMAIFRTLILADLLKGVVISIFVGGATGLLSTALYSYWMKKTGMVLPVQS